MLEAAKFQRIRREHVSSFTRRAPLLLSPGDLRQYRRAVEPEQLLALLLDHTCQDDWSWFDALLPYLRWAYTSRAKICLVQVGRRTARDQLQAEHTMARNVLDPRVRAALEAPAGTATPLAHGLDLLFQTLRHALQHGRTTVRSVWLVVVTDGRGNVPLEDSRAGYDRSPIISSDSSPLGRIGVDDALRVAEQLRSLKRVKKVVIDPAPTPYPELPTAFAESLGAVLVAGRTAEADFGSGADVD
jgi:magnesium chelatase subunit D